MINSCCKCNLRWFEGVVCRKMNCQKEYTALIWAVIRSHNCGLPMKHIIPNWTCRTLCWRVTGQITKFLINPFQCHSLCFSSGSSLSRRVLEGPAKTLDYPGGWEGLSLRLTPALPDTGAEGPGPPSCCSLGLLPARQLVPPRPYRPLGFKRVDSFALQLTLKHNGFYIKR